MKVLFFLGGSYVSGLEIVNLHLLNELVKQDVQVHCVVNGWNNGDIPQRLTRMNLPYTEVKLGGLYWRKPLWTVDTLVHLPGARKKIRQLLHHWKPDLLHFCNYYNVLLLQGLLSAKTVYNLQEPHQASGKHKWIYGMLRRRMARFTTVSLATRQNLLKLGIPAEKIAVIYNGVPAVAKRSGVTEQESTQFGIIGQVAPWKGHETILRAVQILAARGIRTFRVVIYGNDQTAFARSLKEKIGAAGLNRFFCWKGFEKQQQRMYEAIDSVVVPSLSEEPCSLTIIEAMWHAKTVIASDRGGNAELIEHGETGTLFPADDEITLANEMEFLIRDPAIRLQRGEAAHAKAARSFSAERMGRQYLEIYKAVEKNET